MNGTLEGLEAAVIQNLKESFDCCMALINWFKQEKGWNPAETFTGSSKASSTSALHRAAEAGSTEMIEAMIKLGAGECWYAAICH